jgi:hypothetical protein
LFRPCGLQLEVTTKHEGHEDGFMPFAPFVSLCFLDVDARHKAGHGVLGTGLAAVPRPPIFWNLLNALKQLSFWRINSGNNSEITAAEQRDNSKIISDILATSALRGRNAHKPVAPLQKWMRGLNPDWPACFLITQSIRIVKRKMQMPDSYLLFFWPSAAEPHCGGSTGSSRGWPGQARP